MISLLNSLYLYLTCTCPYPFTYPYVKTGLKLWVAGATANQLGKGFLKVWPLVKRVGPFSVATHTTAPVKRINARSRGSKK